MFYFLPAEMVRCENGITTPSNY